MKKNAKGKKIKERRELSRKGRETFNSREVGKRYVHKAGKKRKEERGGEMGSRGIGERKKSVLRERGGLMSGLVRGRKGERGEDGHSISYTIY